MAINWTNNGTDNKWSVGDTATFTATGDLPDWITSGDLDAKPYYVTTGSATPTRAAGDGDTVTYANNKLTITVGISMDINDWTIQVKQKNSSVNILRWPGFGAVSATWADPGCQAVDAESGDLTHQIVRTYEQQNGDSWSAAQSIDQSAGGTYRITYNVTDDNLDAIPVTRVVSFTSPTTRRARIFNDPPPTEWSDIGTRVGENEYPGNFPTSWPVATTYRDKYRGQRSTVTNSIDIGKLYGGQTITAGSDEITTLDFRAHIYERSNDIKMGTVYMPLDDETGDIGKLDDWILDRGNDHGNGFDDYDAIYRNPEADYIRLTVYIKVTRDDGENMGFLTPGYKWTDKQTTTQDMLFHYGRFGLKRKNNSITNYPFGMFGLRNKEVDQNSAFFLTAFRGFTGKSDFGRRGWSVLGRHVADQF